MIPNITHSIGSGNYLGYDLGDKKNQYQKVRFLAAEGVMLDDRQIDRLDENWVDGDENGYLDFRKVAMKIANDLDRQFQAQASLNRRPKIRAINVSLSYSPVDTDKVNEVVYDETRDDYVPLRLKMGREFLDGMGFGDIQYMAVSHLDTHCAHDHYAINTIRADGTTINLKFDYVRAQKLAADIRKKYKLTPPDESLQMITPKAKEALRQSCSWEEYKKQLQKYGISLVFSEHSATGSGYGVSYSFGTKVIPGSKLHRSLSYGQVNATLERNLNSRLAKEHRELTAAYKEMVPTIKKLHTSVENTLHLFEDVKNAGVAINERTTQTYDNLKRSWTEFRNLVAEGEEAKTLKESVKSIGGMMLLLNPIAGFLVLLVGFLAADLRMSTIYEEKKTLLAKIEGMQSDISELKDQKSQIKIEKQERLDAYLQAKDARNDYKKGMDTIKAEINALRKQAEVRRSAAEKLATEPETFIIHNGHHATLYHNGKDMEDRSALEAARMILKCYTWAAGDKEGAPAEEFIEGAMSCRTFGRVKYDMGKARYIGTFLENPEEVIRFEDFQGNVLNLVTSDFRETWNLQKDHAKQYEAARAARLNNAPSTPSQPKKPKIINHGPHLK